MKYISGFVITLLISVSAHATIINKGFLTGNTFKAMGLSSKNVYVVGLIDGMLLAPFYGANEDEVNSLAKCTVGMTGKQLVAIFEKYLRDHPERWNQSMHVIGYAAMHEACSP